MSAVDTLIVVSRARWVADDLYPAAEHAGLMCQHDWGLDVPHVSGRVPAWWVPTGHAARLLASGLTLPLVTPGPAFLDTIPTELLGRPVTTLRYADLAGSRITGAGFGKVAEMKLEDVPARWWDDVSQFQAVAAAAGLHQDAMVQWTPTRLDIAAEYRCYVVDGAVATVSPYLVGGVTWEPDMRTWPGVDTASAYAFAREVVDALPACPRSWVLDVAQLRSGRWAVVEANPSWSAGMYGCVPDAVVAALVAAVDYTGEQKRWAWRPDPHLTGWAARRPLRSPLFAGDRQSAR